MALLGTFLATLICLGMAWLCFALARNVVATNSYESMKRDARRLLGVMCIFGSLLGAWLTIAQLMAPPVVVRKVVKHRKPLVKTEEQ